MVNFYRLRIITFAYISLLWIGIFTSLTLHAEDFQSSFNEGIASFNSQKWEEAIQDFSQALKLDSQNIAANNNLAISHLKKQNFGIAAAYFRKTLELSPGTSEARHGLEMALAKLEGKTIPHEIEFIESIRVPILLSAPPFAFYLLFGVTLFAFAWIWLSYLGKRRRVIEDSYPPPPVIGFLCGLLWIFATVLLGLKCWDMQTPRGTILTDQVPVLAAPEESQVELFTLYSGHEVIIRRSQKDWLQVQYPGGPSGWIKRSDLLLTNNASIGDGETQ